MSMLPGRPLLFAFVVLLAWPVGSAFGQMERQRANPGGPVDEVFWAPTIVGLPSVTNLPQGNLNFAILHAFGVATNGIDDLFGLDGAANIRFGIDYGLTDWLSIGGGRSRFEKLYDFRSKANLLRQTRDDRIPIEVAVQGSVDITTVENGFEFADRLSYSAALLLARRFSDRISLQVTPLFAHRNTVFILRDGAGEILEQENDHFAIGLAGRFVIDSRRALIVEYLPVVGERSDGTRDALSVGLDIETGGHVFQLFFTTSQGLIAQEIIARNTDNFFDGDFRFGFNVNRVFAF